MWASEPRKSLLLISLFLLVLGSASPLAWATDKCGAVCDETWNLAGSPYVLTCDVTVAAGCSLTIAAGVEVRAQAGFELIVDGTLDVNGASGNEVTLTSDAGTPSPGDWDGITLQSSASGTFDHATVSYGVRGISIWDTSVLTGNELTLSHSSAEGLYGRDSAVVNLTGGSLDQNYQGTELFNSVTATLTDVLVTDNTDSGVLLSQNSSATLSGVEATGNKYGFYVYTTAGAPPSSATGSSFTGNQFGVRVRGSGSDPDVTVTGCNIYSNSSWNIYAQTVASADRTVLDATGNWWGTTDESAIRSKIYDHANVASSPMVDWCDYLNGPGGTAARTDVYCADLSICDETVVWGMTDRPYILYTDSVVCPTGSLEIGPDVEVRSVKHPGAGIEVKGELQVNGTAGHETTFTSDVGSPAAGDWQGLAVHSAGTATIDHAVISFVVEGVTVWDSGSLMAAETVVGPCSGDGVIGRNSAVLSLEDGSVEACVRGVELNNDSTATITGTTIANNSDTGIYAGQGASATLTNVTCDSNKYGFYVYVNASAGSSAATGSTFTGNQRGVWVRGTASNPDVTITNNSIHSNTAWDFYAQTFADAETTVVDATGNWWGTTDESAIRAKINDHANSISSPMVDWCAYLDSPGGSVARPDVYCAGLSICDETVVWDQTDQPYVLYSDVVICPTGTLRIEQDVDVRTVLHEGAGIEALGELEVNGTAGHEVSFTSDAAVPSPGAWQGLAVRESGTAMVDNATIAYHVDALATFDDAELTGNGLTISQGSGEGLYAEDASLVALTDATISDGYRGVDLRHSAAATLTDMRIFNFSHAAVYLAQTSSVKMNRVDASLNNWGLYVYTSVGAPPTAAWDCTFTGNTTHGIRVRGSGGDPNVTVTRSSIHSNGQYDVYAQTFANPETTIVWAPNNWWGTTDEEAIAERIYDHADDINSPRVYFRPFGDTCEHVLVGDEDGDGRGDLEDDCPLIHNVDQTDADGDGMGDPCDPDPEAEPTGDCDGIADPGDGYADADGDGWGDLCDFEPTRSDCYPGATEICDGRDNNGNGVFGMGELTDADFDEAFTCGDCDDEEPTIYPCACERCLNGLDDDCDGDSDATDADCQTNPYCIIIATGGAELELNLHTGTCGGATTSGPFEVIRGDVEQLQIAEGSCDLGEVECVDGFLVWDRVTDYSRDPNPACNESAMFFLARTDGAADFGATSDGEPRDVMNPNPPCP